MQIFNLRTIFLPSKYKMQKFYLKIVVFLTIYIIYGSDWKIRSEPTYSEGPDRASCVDITKKMYFFFNSFRIWINGGLNAYLILGPSCKINRPCIRGFLVESVKFFQSLLWMIIFTPMQCPNFVTCLQFGILELWTKHRVCSCCRHAMRTKKSPFKSWNTLKTDCAFTIVAKLFFPCKNNLEVNVLDLGCLSELRAHY